MGLLHPKVVEAKKSVGHMCNVSLWQGVRRTLVLQRKRNGLLKKNTDVSNIIDTGQISVQMCETLKE